MPSVRVRLYILGEHDRAEAPGAEADFGVRAELTSNRHASGSHEVAEHLSHVPIGASAKGSTIVNER